MARARKGGTVKTKMGFLIYGRYGTWKSSMALQFAKMKREDGKPFRVVYIDTEAGSVDSYLEDYENSGVDINNIYIVYTQSIKEVNSYIAKIKNNEDLYELDDNGVETSDIVLDGDGLPFRADAIVIDSVSVLYIASQQGLTEFSKKRARVRATKNELVGLEKQVTIEGAGLEIKDYNTLKFDGQDLILSLLGCGKHFAVTAREVDEKENKETDEKGKYTSVATGRKLPDGFKDISYNVKTVLHMIEDEMGNVMAQIENKDRTGVHLRGEIIENPTLLDWAVIVEKNRGKEDYTLENSIHDAIKKEEERYMATNSETMNDEKKVEEKAEELSIDEYKNKIKSIVDNLEMGKKKALTPKLQKLGLTTKYQNFTDIEDLKKFYEILLV